MQGNGTIKAIAEGNTQVSKEAGEKQGNYKTKSTMGS